MRLAKALEAASVVVLFFLWWLLVALVLSLIPDGKA